MKLRLACFAATSLLLSGSASAAPTAYWRFEDNPGFLADSSGNGLTLTNNGSATQNPLPGSGPGSDFDDPLPGTGVANNHMVSLVGGSEHLSHPFDGLFSGLTELTIESYLNLQSFNHSNYALIAGHYGPNPPIRGWLLMVNNSSSFANPGELFLFMSPDGSTLEAIGSGFTVPLGDDVYVAASFDANMSGPGNGGATFCLKNLTTGGTLQSATVDHSSPSINSPSVDFLIGGGISTFSVTGVIDEVRFLDPC